VTCACRRNEAALARTEAPSRSPRLAAANPPLTLMVLGALAWGSMMALSAALAIYVRNGFETDSALQLVILYFLGGLLAWPGAISLARFCGYGSPIETRFAAHLLWLSIGTMAMTAFLFALDYRIFYSRWHAPFGSIIWMFQFAFTGASAVYQFAVLGSRLFMPLGLLFLVATSSYLARLSR
jgi:hypothetical protein